MKRGTPDHPKTHDLAAALDLDRWGAVGLLECLFHFTAQYAKRGDIGRRSDAAIARGIGWGGKPEALVDAFVRAGWLDRCCCHRLRVHDWTDHCDQTVSRSEELKKHGFIECYEDASAALVSDEREASQPLPLPLPLPKPMPMPTPLPEPTPGRANPLVAGQRPRYESECLQMARDLADLEDRDPVEVMAERSDYPGSKRPAVNPASMSDNRLANTWRDLKADLDVARKKKRGPGSVTTSARVVT